MRRAPTGGAQGQEADASSGGTSSRGRPISPPFALAALQSMPDPFDSIARLLSGREDVPLSWYPSHIAAFCGSMPWGKNKLLRDLQEEAEGFVRIHLQSGIYRQEDRAEV